MYYVHMYGIGHTQPIWHVHIGKSRGYGVYRGVHRGWGAGGLLSAYTRGQWHGGGTGGRHSTRSALPFGAGYCRRMRMFIGVLISCETNGYESKSSSKG